MSNRTWSRRDLLASMFRLEQVPAVPPGYVHWVQPSPDEGRIATLPFAVLPQLRPPGAVAEQDFRELCSRCDRCIDACPRQVLVASDGRGGAPIGSPVFDPKRGACTDCDDRPCVAACTSGALDRTFRTKMGTARIDSRHCQASSPNLCSNCIERCPVDGALSLVEGRPTVHAAACTGCAQCRDACPAPQNAISIVPALLRPEAPRYFDEADWVCSEPTYPSDAMNPNTPSGGLDP